MNLSLILSRYSLLKAGLGNDLSPEARAHVSAEMQSIEQKLGMDGELIMRLWSRWLHKVKRDHRECERTVKALTGAEWDIGAL